MPQAKGKPHERVFLSARKSRQTYNGYKLVLHPDKPDSKADEVFQVAFNPEAGESNLILESNGLGPRSLLLECGEEIRDVLALHSAICRLMTFDPKSVGLRSSRSISGEHAGESADAMSLYQEGFFSHRLYATSLDLDVVISRGLLRIIPKDMREASYFWHSGKTTPTAFGTPVLAPTLCVNDDEDGVAQEGWRLHLLGLEDYEPLAYAVWNDAAGIARLVEQMASMTPEAGLALAALTADSELESVPVLRVEHEQRVVRPIAAQEWNSKNVLRPILVKRAISAAEEETAPTRHSGRKAPRLQRFWFSAVTDQRLFRTYESTMPEKTVAIRGATLGDTRPDELTPFAIALQARLDERSLGTVVLARTAHRSGEDTLFIVKDMDFFQSYPALFDVADTRSIRTASHLANN